MGKRVKKKGRVQQKNKRIELNSPKTVPDLSNVGAEPVVESVIVPKERKLCSHLDNGFKLEVLSEKFASEDPCRCESCREDAGDRRGNKGKGGKHGKKKGGASADSKSDTKRVWVCLECGHYGCGGVGMPTTSQSHAVRHAKQARHPLVIQLENPHLRWCFSCDTLIPVDKAEENGDIKDALADVVKLIKSRSSEKSPADVEDIWFGSGSITAEIKAEGISSSLEGKCGYLVRGLVNLGNTCFFNSVMQNLLAMDKLRDFFFNQCASFGPLSTALKKLYIETKPENGLKSAINPKPFFTCVCSKAPHFRGYQQHDSHELLRCLLDGLSTEELVLRKQMNTSLEDGEAPKDGPSFVEATFGGRISSTVCCVECGHSSTVYEPFLDLSLPVPTRKPPTKTIQTVSRAKKSKLPPKRAGRTRPKANRITDSVATDSISNPSVSSNPSKAQPTTAVAENVNDLSSDNTELDSAVSDESGLTSQNLLVTQKTENEQVVEQAAGNPTTASFDVFDSSWMDFLGQGTSSDKEDFTSENNDQLINQNPVDKFMLPNDGVMESSQEFTVDGVPNVKPDLSSVNPWEEEGPLQILGSEVLLLPYKEESYANGDITKGEAEASSSVVGDRQEEVDFDGLGDLFGEPEVSVGHVAGPSLASEDAESSFMGCSISESDPDEVDDTDSPVSIESCLVHFIKPELLTNDNAWECESCSKTLHHQSPKAKAIRDKDASRGMMNKDEMQIQNHVRNSDEGNTFSATVTSLPNGNIDSDITVNFIYERTVLNNELVDCPNHDSRPTEDDKSSDLKLLVSQSEELKDDGEPGRMEQDGGELCNLESSSGLDVGSLCLEEPDGREQYQFQITGNREPQENEEEKSAKKPKVKRDATKRVLIDKAPPILTIHLKRFSQDARGRLSKLNGHVNFRDVIDLTPYLDPRCGDTEKYVYRVLGVVEHLGTMRGGHYVAYVRGQRSKGKTAKQESTAWYHISDAYVREVSLEEVLRCEAYILFYEKV